MMARDFEDISVSVTDQVAVITLDRPELLNAFTATMGRELGEAYASCDADDGIRAVVLTGRGRAFCAGADLARGSRTFAEPGREFSASPVDPPAWAVRKPVIAAVNGHAIGIGMGLAMQCDIRIMAEGAKYGFVHVRRGVLADVHTHWTLPRAVGFSAAAELLLTGRHFTATEAVEMGLASRAVAADEVLTTARELAGDVVANVAPLSVALSKHLLWSSPTPGRDETAELETGLHRLVMGTADATEAMAAYLERRPPRWKLSVPRDWPPELPSGR